MPTSKPKRLCKAPGCRNLVPVGTGALCEEHGQEYQRKVENRRQSSYDRGYNTRWRKVRKMFLTRNPLCVSCLKEHQRETLATVVDHIVPHRGDYDLFWDESNWQSLCARCHGRKTAKEDGGFGNPTEG